MLTGSRWHNCALGVRGAVGLFPCEGMTDPGTFQFQIGCLTVRRVSSRSSGREDIFNLKFNLIKQSRKYQQE